MSRRKIDTERIEQLLAQSSEQDPPAWLKQAIMYQVSREKKTLLQRISGLLVSTYTVRIRPLQVGAVVAIAVLAFWAGTLTSTDELAGGDGWQITIPAENAMANYLVGRALLTADQHQQALQYLNKAVELQPEMAEFVHWQGVAFWAAGNPELERQSYYRSTESRPDYVPSLVNLGHSYLENGSYENALQYYKQALEIDPSQPEALYNSALTHRMLNDSSQERKALESYLQFYRTGKWAHRAVSHLHRLGDFNYRSYTIGDRRVVLNMKSLLDMDGPEYLHELANLSGLVRQTNGQELHLVFYNDEKESAAKEAALKLRQQLLQRLDHQSTPPLRVSWFGAKETVGLADGVPKQLSPSLLIFTRSLDTNNNGRNSI